MDYKTTDIGLISQELHLQSKSLSRRKRPEIQSALMENAAGHALDQSYEGVQIESLPKNTTSLVQAVDQSLIHAFKVLYTGNSLQQLVEVMNSDDSFTMKEY